MQDNPAAKDPNGVVPTEDHERLVASAVRDGLGVSLNYNLCLRDLFVLSLVVVVDTARVLDESPAADITDAVLLRLRDA
jgi:hypothetical protein